MIIKKWLSCKKFLIFLISRKFRFWTIFELKDSIRTHIQTYWCTTLYLSFAKKMKPLISFVQKIRQILQTSRFDWFWKIAIEKSANFSIIMLLLLNFVLHWSLGPILPFLFFFIWFGKKFRFNRCFTVCGHFLPLAPQYQNAIPIGLICYSILRPILSNI